MAIADMPEPVVIGPATLLQGDCLAVMPTLPDNSVHCCVTSPPYFGLRDYGHPDQIGLEDSPDAYVTKMVGVFREVRRILRDDGVLFLNVGDSYAHRSTIIPQRYKIRDDVTYAEKCHVAMEMFGMRIDGDGTPGEGVMQEVLPEGSEGSPICGKPGMARHRVKVELSTQQGNATCLNAREAEAIKVDSNRDAGREVRLLWGSNAGVLNGGSHQRRRCGTQEESNGKESSQQHEDLQGHHEPGISEGQVPRSVLQLQLLNRVLGILSSHTYAANEIPNSVRFAFAPIVAYKPKDLIGIPWMLAFALRADGWYLRQDIIWAKPNPMPESVTDRCTKSHEYVFLLTKSAQYFWDSDAMKEKSNYPEGPGNLTHKYQNADIYGAGNPQKNLTKIGARETRNRRSVWSIASQPYDGAHFAVMPKKLVEPCILAGCPVGGTVLDPFNGAATVGIVALEHGRQYLGIELNPEYVRLSVGRLTDATRQGQLFSLPPIPRPAPSPQQTTPFGAPA